MANNDGFNSMYYSNLNGTTKTDAKKEHKERVLKMLVDRQNIIKAKVVDK